MNLGGKHCGALFLAKSRGNCPSAPRAIFGSQMLLGCISLPYFLNLLNVWQFHSPWNAKLPTTVFMSERDWGPQKINLFAGPFNFTGRKWCCDWVSPPSWGRTVPRLITNAKICLPRYVANSSAILMKDVAASAGICWLTNGWRLGSERP